MRIRAAWEGKLQEKLRERRWHEVVAVAVGARATEKAEIFMELQAILKAEKEGGRNLERHLRPLRPLWESKGVSCSRSVAVSALRVNNNDMEAIMHAVSESKVIWQKESF